MEDLLVALASLDAQGIVALVLSMSAGLHLARGLCSLLRPVVLSTETETDDKILAATRGLLGALTGFLDIVRGEKPATKKVVKNG